MAYKDIVNVELLRPIKDEERYQESLKEIESLIFKDNLSEEEEDYLEILCVIVQQYEDKHHNIQEEKDPIEILKYLLEQNNMNGSDLGKLLGQRQLGSKILNKKRELSKKHIAILSERFKVSADLFLK